MRIIGGKYRGAILANVGKGDVLAQLRPTADRVRENIFNLLINLIKSSARSIGLSIAAKCPPS